MVGARAPVDKRQEDAADPPSGPAQPETRMVAELDDRGALEQRPYGAFGRLRPVGRQVDHVAPRRRQPRVEQLLDLRGVAVAKVEVDRAESHFRHGLVRLRAVAKAAEVRAKLGGLAKVDRSPLRDEEHRVELAVNVLGRLVDGGERNAVPTAVDKVLHDLARGRGVEPAGGLVEDDDARARRLAHRDRQEPALAARQVTHRTVAAPLETPVA